MACDRKELFYTTSDLRLMSVPMSCRAIFHFGPPVELFRPQTLVPTRKGVRRSDPGPGSRTQISTQGGAEPVWAQTGRELFSAQATRCWRRARQQHPRSAPDGPTVLFHDSHMRHGNGINYDVAPTVSDL